MQCKVTLALVSSFLSRTTLLDVWTIWLAGFSLPGPFRPQALAPLGDAKKTAQTDQHLSCAPFSVSLFSCHSLFSPIFFSLFFIPFVASFPVCQLAPVVTCRWVSANISPLLIFAIIDYISLLVAALGGSFFFFWGLSGVISLQFPSFFSVSTFRCLHAPTTCLSNKPYQILIIQDLEAVRSHR